MEKDFLKGLYWEKWYNEGNDADFPCPNNPDFKGPCPIDQADRMIMHANRLLGVPRMRQLRVNNQSCVIPDNFKSVIKVCYGSYSSGEEDISDFGPGYRKFTSADA